ncbi:endo-1,4-beta-xylanase [Butyrivibrio sp. AE3004]|uniref:endo-1,4-beta-xylanase n=1 Tax=Butyrivibrio sp. AE3004 TaxID=1506994 RepID=UPI0006918FCC|nr:endo-1,4-beta-xylanase [Butyrivibrio sp. AE3004]
MHKKMLGLSSLLMAGMLTVSSVGTGALQVQATDGTGYELTEDSAEGAAEENTEAVSEEKKEEAAGESEVSKEEVKEENTSGSFEEKEESTEKEASKDAEVTSEEGKKADSEETSEKSEDGTENKGEDSSETSKEKTEGVNEEKSGEVAEGQNEEKTEGQEGVKTEDKNEETEEGQTTKKTEESGEEKTGTDAKEETEIGVDNGLVFFDRWNQSSTFNSHLKFEKQYQEYVSNLGEAVKTENLNSITVKVSDQENNVCIKLYDSTLTEKMANYSCNGKSEYTIVPNYDGDVQYVAVMSMAEGDAAYPYSIKIDSIDVDKKEVAPVENEKTLVFEGDDLKFTDHWEGTEVDGATLVFDKEWREYGISLGEDISGDALKSITLKTKEKTASLGVKLYGEDKQTNSYVDYGKSGSDKYVLYPATTDVVNEFAIMAMNNQDYPFNVDVERIEVVVDTTPESEKPEKGVETDIVDLRDPMTAILGDDFIVGTAISYMEFADEMEMELVTKHFNGVTLGNELKPDSMLKKDANIIDYDLNGETIQVPELNYETPERYLDFFVKWNEEHPDKQIKIRGHVLVWHSQTPEFFFHEDYDTEKPYVTPDVMNKRLEYYIKSVAEHFTSPESKYHGMFYGWDVVNEAVSDSTGTYRNGNENSSWWRVYNSPEFIQNAFVFANRYMDPEISLFYNDYNETMSNKMKGICKLLSDVKATPGARIDGMGMQAHYQIAANDPSIEAFKTAARSYGEIVDQVQVTELDYKGSANSKDTRLAERYKALYDAIRRLKAEGVNITGMTIWGVVDKHSWLQTANNNGGGSNGSARQYPLLFDDYYKAKNAFYALAEAGDLEPEIKNVTLIQNIGDEFSAGESYGFAEGETKAVFVPMWNEGEVDVKVTVTDSTVDEADSFTVYVDDTTEIKAVTVKRSEADATEDGYEKVVKVAVDNEALSSNKVKLDVHYTNGDKTFAYGDTSLNAENGSKYFAETVVKPLLSVNKGTVVVDGKADDDAWKTVKAVPLAINVGAQVSAEAKLLWDDEKLYVLADVKDSVLNKDASQAHEQDSLEVFIDENNNKTSSYQEDDKQYRINYENAHSFNGTKCLEENMESAVELTEDGYRVEAAFKWTDITPAAGSKVGLELQINDANETGKRIGTLSWADKSGNGWSSTEVFGTILLKGAEETPSVEEPGTEEPKEDPKTDEPKKEEPKQDQPKTDAPKQETPKTDANKTNNDKKPATESKPAKETEKVAALKTAETPVGKDLTYTGKEQVGVDEKAGFTVTGNKQTDAGTYTATATLKDGYSWSDGSTAPKSVSFTIKKADNTLTVKAKTAKVKASKLKKKNQKVKVSSGLKVKDAQGDVTYKKVSGNKNIKIDSKTGKITVKKGLKKGLYKIKVTITAAGNDNYDTTEETVTFKVRVK